MIKRIFEPHDLPMEELETLGLVKYGRINLDDNNLAALFSGRRTDMIRLENLFSDHIHIPLLDARLSLKQNRLGEVILQVHPIYREARHPLFLSAAEGDRLETGKTVNIQKTIYDDPGYQKEVLIEFDRETREFIVTDIGKILVPDKVNNELISPEQKEQYRKGEVVRLAEGTVFQYSGTDSKGVRSNKKALVATAGPDEQAACILYQGLNPLPGQNRDKDEAAAYSDGYYHDLEMFGKQCETRESADRPVFGDERGYPISR